MERNRKIPKFIKNLEISQNDKIWKCGEKLKRVTIYPNLEAELARKGIGRTELGKLLDICQAGASAKMSGKAQFSIPQILTVKEHLGFTGTIEELLKKEA